MANVHESPLRSAFLAYQCQPLSRSGTWRGSCYNSSKSSAGRRPVGTESEYERYKEPYSYEVRDRRVRGARGLQAVDGLTTSAVFDDV